MKKVFVLLILSVLIYTTFLIYKETIKTEYQINYYYLEESESINLSVFLEQNGIIDSYHVSYLTDDKVKDVFSYLSSRNNLAPINTKSHIPLSTRLISYTVNDDILSLNLSSEFTSLKTIDTYKALKEVMLTYRSLGFKNVFLLVNGTSLTSINNWNLEKGLSNIYLNTPILW